MRRALIAILVLFAACMVSGMGSLGGTPEGEIPKTEENVKVQLVDRSGVTTELSRFTMDGKLLLKGRRGEGDVTVLFRELKEVTFGQMSGNQIPADLQLKSGKRVQLSVDKGGLFYGDTGFGTFRISASEVSRIIFRK